MRKGQLMGTGGGEGRRTVPINCQHENHHQHDGHSGQVHKPVNV